MTDYFNYDSFVSEEYANKRSFLSDWGATGTLYFPDYEPNDRVIDSHLLVGGVNATDFDNKMSDYLDSSFKVGDNDTFRILFNDFKGKVKPLMQQMDDYVAEAEEAKAAIEAAIAKDEAAMKLAEEAYDAVMADDESFMIAVAWDTNTNEVLKYEVDKEAQKAAAEEEKKKTFEANCWKPGK